MFKVIRVALLLIVLASVLGTYLIQQNVTNDWSGALQIKIVPVIADDQGSTKAFVQALRADNFAEISDYLTQSAKHYGLDLSNSLVVDLEPAINDVPPTLPNAGSGFITQAVWALKLRWWAWRHQGDDYRDNQIRLFLLCQSPQEGVVLPHSTGLRNGLIGLIHARANIKNKRLHNVILTHELMHIFGATDKYDLATGQPVFPDGYAKPSQQPSVPQRYAEIMGRSIPVTQTRFEVAERLAKTRVGSLTAKEIGWTN